MADVEAFHRTSIGFAMIIYHLQPFWIVLAPEEALSEHKTGWICLAIVGRVLPALPRSGHADG
ncbi:hypothetical protein [Mesorhizobium sp.]|uniref:hypothetical protein n=1 Tax=Mesorhizobium sp. TaxID=1871066 RepID=UPI0012218C05|nr:hypothetical protein [Mesorhizobium sp.]TIV60196.1 MAG: hypothetical protein E5V80_10430 [Mesorhizobium sp.]